MNLFDLLRSDGSIVVNKGLAHAIGLNEAIIYSELVSLHEYWRKRGKLLEDAWFYCTVENLENNTTIKRKLQEKTVKNLVDLELIEVKRMGLPAKRYFRVTDKIYDIILQKDRHNQNVPLVPTREDERSQLERTNGPINNTSINNTNKININNIYNDTPERELPFYDWLNED